MTDAMRHRLKAERRRLQRAVIRNRRIIESDDSHALKRSAAMSTLERVIKDLEVIAEVLESE